MPPPLSAIRSRDRWPFASRGPSAIPSKFDTGNPKDPRLDVQASYRTSDGDTLFVYVTGTLTHPEVKFDRPREQAMAVLLKDDASATNLGIGVLDTIIGDTPLARGRSRGSTASK